MLAGLSLGASFVIPATWVAQDVFEHGIIDPVWAGVAIVAGSAIFHPQVRALGLLVMRLSRSNRTPVAVEDPSVVPVSDRTPNTSSIPAEVPIDLEVAEEVELVGSHLRR